MKKMNKGFTLIELIIVIAILGIIALIAVPNLAGIRQRSQVSADIRTAEQIGKAIRIWATDDDGAAAEVDPRIIPSGTAATDPILHYAYYVEPGAEGVSEGFYKFAGVDYYVGVDYTAKSMSEDATYFISSIGEGITQKIIVGIDEFATDSTKAPKALEVKASWENKDDIKADEDKWWYEGGAAGWAYVEQ